MLASSRSRRRSTVPRSARISSSSSISASRLGSTEPSGCGTVSDSKARTTCTNASTPRSAGRSTSAGPRPWRRPGTSTYSTVASVVFFGWKIPASPSTRGSGTRAMPTRASGRPPAARRRRAGEELEQRALADEGESEDARLHAGDYMWRVRGRGRRPAGVESAPGDAARPARSRAPGRRPPAVAAAPRPRIPARRRHSALQGAGPVILFLIDNSASLPPLDPSEKRVAALEKMFTLPAGPALPAGAVRRPRRDRGRRRLAYRNDGPVDRLLLGLREGQGASRRPTRAGPSCGMVLLTDAISDPDPADWKDLPPGWDVALALDPRAPSSCSARCGCRSTSCWSGEPPGEAAAATTPSSRPGFVLDMVRAANGRAAAPLAQTLAGFFADDGLLLRKFVYRVRAARGPEEDRAGRPPHRRSAARRASSCGSSPTSCCRCC